MGQVEGQDEPKERSCCRTSALCFLMILVALGGGMLLWQFMPEEQKGSILGVEDGAPLSYNFMQCTDLTNCCNGLDTICDKTANSILYAGTHNSMASRDEGFRIYPNHDRRLEDSLEAGYRALNVDLGKCNGEMRLLHGPCQLGTRDPVEVFSNVNDFLTTHPSEVILLIMQIASDEITFNDIDGLFAEVGNFRSRMYNHTRGLEWPTLRTLVETDQRIIFFQYNGVETCHTDPCPTGFHDWFRFAAETEFSFSDLQEIENTTASCAITRGRKFPEFFGVNLFVTLPSKAASQVLNTKVFLENHIQACSDLNRGWAVNVVLIDFWSQGDLPEFTQLYNGLLATLLPSDESSAPTTLPPESEALAPTSTPSGSSYPTSVSRVSDSPSTSPTQPLRSLRA